MTPLISIQDLRLHAGEQLVASLDSLQVNAGECVALVGESGSGKTTSLLAMLGLTTGLRVTGRISAAGVEVVGAAERDLARIRGSRLALISQSPQGALNPTLRLGTLMKRALARHGVRGEAARQRTEEALKSALLDPVLLHRYPHQVSGGQAQRFAIALAVALRAEVILADEPTSALDVTVQAGIIALLRRLKDEHGTALVLVSHDLALVSGIADHVVVMRGGRVVESGTAETVLTRPSEAYTRELLDAVPVLRR
jgi:peptide/nickel transport system ATP-binding protein